MLCLFPARLFSKHVILISALFSLKLHCCWNADICAVRGALLRSLSLRVQLKGLVCAWVPRIMISAAEKHIFTFQEIRAGNLQAEDLTSSLWLIVELTKKKSPTNRQQPGSTMPSAQVRGTPTTVFLLLWNHTKITLRTCLTTWLSTSLLNNSPILYYSLFISHQEIRSGMFPTETPHLIFQF